MSNPYRNPDNPYQDSDGLYRPIVMSEATESSAVYAAARSSWAAANTKDRETWLGLWNPDGRIEDPVGKSFLDPEGNGHHGPEGLATFWDNSITTPDHIEFRFDRAVALGEEMLCVGTIRTHLGDQIMDAEGGAFYRVDAEGRMLSLRAFWETDVAMATLRPASEG